MSKQTNKEQPTRTIWNTDLEMLLEYQIYVIYVYEKRWQDVEFQHKFRINIRIQLLILRAQMVNLIAGWAQQKRGLVKKKKNIFNSEMFKARQGCLIVPLLFSIVLVNLIST